MPTETKVALIFSLSLKSGEHRRLAEWVLSKN
jgi:hypothetical protein